MNRKVSQARGSAPRFPAATDRRAEFEAQALPHLRPLYNLALRLSRNEKDAEDLVQDTYLRAYRFFHRFEPGTNIRAWLFRILKNQFLNQVQQAKSTAFVDDFDALTESNALLESAFPHSRGRTPEQEVLDSVTAAEVEQALGALPPEYRIVVSMALIDEMSYKDIAEALQIPMGTVMSRLHRGRRILQERLFDYVAHRHLVGREALAAVAAERTGAVSH